MEDLSRRKVIKNVIGGALIAATSTSIIGCDNKSNGTLSSNSVVTRTQDGQELRLTIEGEKVMVEKVSNGKISDAKPSGTFTLRDGKTIIVDKGIITGGDSGGGAASKFAAFALLTADKIK